MYGEQQEKSEHDAVGERGMEGGKEASIENRAEDVLECVREEEA